MANSIEKTTVFNASILEFPRIENRAGNITPIERLRDIPINIERIFYIYDIPGGKDRGAHAHKECHQILIAASGSFDVMMDDGVTRRTVNLNRPYFGLHIPPGIWAAEQNFSSGAICLVIASTKYNESDYIRDYEEFKRFKRNIYT